MINASIFPVFIQVCDSNVAVLLVSFSDQVVAVREAAECAARSMMSKLSAQGVKLVLPSILKVPFVDLIVTYSAHLFDKIQ